jgi:CcmD family protein
MMKTLKTLFYFIAFLGPAAASAQGGPVEMADAFRANGKIYVVVAIISVIFIGLGAYLFHLDRKISKLEKQNDL